MEREKSLEEQIKEKAGQVRGVARYMSSIEELVEEQIKKAREKGAFDNLENKGKPIYLPDNPFEPPELRMGFKMLKDAGFAPYWVEVGKDIDAAKATLLEQQARFKKLCDIARERPNFNRDHRFLNRKENFFAEQRELLSKINRLVDDFNLQCPTFHVTRGKINVDEEMMKIVIEIESYIESQQR
ncbi:MAG: DnaJ family domain-containing protein [Methylocystaceae bacterium]